MFLKNKENIFEKKEEEKRMENTQDFKKALEQGRLQEAEDFLLEVQADKEKFAEKFGDVVRWLDHRQRELFQAYYKKEDWTGAKRIVEATEDPQIKFNRAARLADLSGLKYEEI